MEEDGSTPGIKAFHAALEALKDAGQWEKASDVKKANTKHRRKNQGDKKMVI